MVIERGKVVQNDDLKFMGIGNIERVLRVMVAIGVTTLILSAYFSPTRALTNLLVDNLYFVSLSLFGGFFLSLVSVTNSSFASPYKRILEATSAYLPYGFVIMFFLVIFGGHHLYLWSVSSELINDELLKGKSSFLNLPFFLFRMIFYFGLWIIFTKILVNKSRQQDHSANPMEISNSIAKYSSVFLVIFSLTYSFASFDWIMSLEPRWYSTIFGIYCFASMFVIGLAFTSIAVILLKANGYLKNHFGANQYHDLAKMLFGFTTFFAYIWFCQYLLIWYANLPDEVSYYVLRERREWRWPFWSILLFSWIVPFLALMPRNLKRGPFVLGIVSLLVLTGQWINIWIMVAPKIYEVKGLSHSFIGLTEIGMALGFVGLFGLIFFNELKKASLVPINDPFLSEALSLEQ